ncbi:hypothetical protein BH11BAC3_BH11BAC3_08620 [soil metagenome]
MPRPIYNAQLQAEYQRLFDTCHITPNLYPAVDKYVDMILKGRSRYEAVGAKLNIPWYFIGLTHCMEGNCNFTKHLHNGDPLTARTVQVPKNRPAQGNPPFTWEVSAEDALRYQGLDKWTDWGIPGMLYQLEAYNGYGYRYLKAPNVPINSPYLWSFSNIYTKGKYTSDGKYSATAVSKQCGVAVMLRRIFEKQLATTDTNADPLAMLKQLGKEVNYAPSRYVAKAEELQRQLNLNGAILKVDGKAGKISSDAYKKLVGEYLHGDPREGT